MRAIQFKPLLRALAPVFAALTILLVTGCNGDDTPGEGAPKRAVEPRSEALRYFPATTPAIGLLETGSEDRLSEIDAALEKVPGWRAMRDRVERSLRDAGIDPHRILELSAQPAGEIELPAPEIAFGTVPGSGPQAARALITLATEQGVAMDKTFREAAKAGGLEVAGEFDGARLYRGPDLDFAIRDGVLIAAADINRVQQAIARRDGDRDAQLDDAPITALLNELPQTGPLRAWAGPGPGADALLNLLSGALEPAGGSESEAGEAPPPASEAALEVSGRDGRVAAEMIVKTEAPEEVAPSPGEEDEPPSDEAPVPIAISPEALAGAFAGLPADSPLRGLAKVAPLAGAVWVDGSAVRARLISAD